MVANCSTDEYVGCVYNKGDGKCHHPRIRQGCALPRFEPGRINCLWGVRHFDAADMIRVSIASSKKRVVLGEEPDYELEEHQREVAELDKEATEKSVARKQKSLRYKCQHCGYLGLFYTRSRWYIHCFKCNGKLRRKKDGLKDFYIHQKEEAEEMRWFTLSWRNAEVTLQFLPTKLIATLFANNVCVDQKEISYIGVQFEEEETKDER